MIYGLKETVVKKIQQILSAYPDVHNAILYGSLAIGDYKSGSVPGEGFVSTVEKKTFDIAGYIYQVLWKGTGTQDVHILAGTTVGDDDPNFSNWSTFASVEAYGLIGSRPHDRMGVSLWFSGITRNLKDLIAITVGRDTGNIWGMELYYNYQDFPMA